MHITSQKPLDVRGKKRISLSDILTGEYRDFGMHGRSIIKVARGLRVHHWLQMLHR